MDVKKISNNVPRAGLYALLKSRSQQQQQSNNNNINNNNINNSNINDNEIFRRLVRQVYRQLHQILQMGMSVSQSKSKHSRHFGSCLKTF